MHLDKCLNNKDYLLLILILEYLIRYPFENTYSYLVNIFLKLKDTPTCKYDKIPIYLIGFIHIPIIDFLFGSGTKSITHLPIVQAIMDLIQKVEFGDDLVGSAVKSLHLLPYTPKSNILLRQLQNHPRLKIIEESKKLLELLS